MKKSWKLLFFLVAVIVAGCSAASRPQMNTNVDDVILTATTRAKDEWFCRDVTGTLKGVKEPPPRKNWYDPDTPPIYTVAVAGCGRSDNYWVVCPTDAVRCYAIVPGEKAPMYIEELIPGSGIYPQK